VTEIEISKIDISKWDARKSEEEDEDIEALMRSIEKDGLMNPILVTPREDRYLLLAGRRRLNASKLLGRTAIMAVIKHDIKDEGDIRRLTFVENHVRKDLTQEEKAIGMLEVYLGAGYAGDESLTYLKCLYNNGYKVGRTDFEVFKRQLWQKGVVSVSIPPKQFVTIVESIGYSPNTQYQWLQIAYQMEGQVLSMAEKYGLRRDRMTLLTHSRLRNHPKVQMRLAKLISQAETDEEARVLVYQAINDLETGALYKVGNGYLRSDIKQDKLSKDIVLQPTEQYLKIAGTLLRLFSQMTERPLTRGEYEYTQEIVSKTKNYRLRIVKSLNNAELRSLKQDMEIFGTLVDEFLDLVSKEKSDRKRKEEFLKR